MHSVCLALVLACAPFQQGVIRPLENTLDRVTVYPGQALVERLCTVAAPEAGTYTLILPRLSLYLDPVSFQTRVEEGPAVVQGVETRIGSGDGLDPAERERLRAALDELRRERRGLEADRVSIEAGKELIRAISQGLTAGQDGSDSALAQALREGRLETLEMLWKFVRERSAELEREYAGYQESSAHLDQRIAEHERQLGLDGGQGHSSYLEGRVSLSFDRPGTAVLRATYLVSGATWRPLYSVRVAPDLTGVTVGQVAEVAQSSGEEWRDVRLLLSTSAPVVGLQSPEVALRVLEEYPLDQPPSIASRPAPAAGSNGPEELLDFSGPSFGDQAVSLLFAVPEPQTLASDGAPHRFTMREVPLEVRPYRHVVPTRGRNAFLRAEVKWSGEDPLLPGAAQVFLGPDFLGEQEFPFLRPGQSTVLDLGVDPNLAVSWETMVDERDEPGFLSSTVEITRVYRATLKLSATAPGPVEVEMQESIPISRSGRIKVKAAEMQPAPLRDEAALREQEEFSRYRWRFRLAPGQSQNVRWGYRVEFDESVEPELIER